MLQVGYGERDNDKLNPSRDPSFLIQAPIVTASSPWYHTLVQKVASGMANQSVESSPIRTNNWGVHC